MHKKRMMGREEQKNRINRKREGDSKKK